MYCLEDRSPVVPGDLFWYDDGESRQKYMVTNVGIGESGQIIVHTSNFDNAMSWRFFNVSEIDLDEICE